MIIPRLLLTSTAVWAATLSPSPDQAATGVPTGTGRALAEPTRDDIISMSKDEGQLVIAGGLADDLADPRLLPGFSDLYPWIEVLPIFLDTTATITRIAQEAQADRSTVDIVDTSLEGVVRLQEFGAFEPPITALPHLADFIEGSQPDEGLFMAAFFDTRTLAVYNSDVFGPDEVPQTWDELCDPRFAADEYRDRIGMSTSSDDLPLRLARLFADENGGELNWDKAEEIVSCLAELRPAISNGYSQGITQLLSGDLGFVVWFPPGAGSLARDAVEHDAPVAVVPGDRYLVEGRAMAVPIGAPHPASAWLFLDYVSSLEGQRAVTDGVAAMLPVNELAETGALGSWLVDGGVATPSEARDDDRAIVLDAEEAHLLYGDEELNQRSADMYNEALGIAG